VGSLNTTGLKIHGSSMQASKSNPAPIGFIARRRPTHTSHERPTTPKNLKRHSFLTTRALKKETTNRLFHLDEDDSTIKEGDDSTIARDDSTIVTDSIATDFDTDFGSSVLSEEDFDRYSFDSPKNSPNVNNSYDDIDSVGSSIPENSPSVNNLTLDDIEPTNMSNPAHPSPQAFNSTQLHDIYRYFDMIKPGSAASSDSLTLSEAGMTPKSRAQRKNARILERNDGFNNLVSPLLNI